ncbi:MAG: hypothetical protein WBA74_06515, partial [Cyclobacteriaceae bacterium]
MKRYQILSILLFALAFIVGCNDDEQDNGITPVAGTLTGGPFTFVVDGVPDNVSGITVDMTDVAGTNSSFVVTNDANEILGLPPTMEALEGVDFDDAGVGVCFIWYIRYENDLEGLDVGQNTGNLSG